LPTKWLDYMKFVLLRARLDVPAVNQITLNYADDIGIFGTICVSCSLVATFITVAAALI